MAPENRPAPPAPAVAVLSSSGLRANGWAVRGTKRGASFPHTPRSLLVCTALELTPHPEDRVGGGVWCRGWRYPWGDVQTRHPPTIDWPRPYSLLPGKA